MTARKMKFEDWLDDLCVRFIMNLPQADLTSMARICFLVEEAHWFYEDFIRPLDHSLPSMNLRNFCLAIFRRCPLLAPFPIQDHVRAFEEFLKYKISVPVRGAILLNETMDMALLVKGWKKGAHWSFPKGKINMDEDDLDCAIREVDEETGFDIRAADLVPPPDEVKFIEATFRDQQIRLYVFRNVPLDTHFEPKTRKEISKIQWYKIADLPTYRKKNAANAAAHANGNSSSQHPHAHHPHAAGHETDDPAGAPSANKFYMVAPFIGPLKKWVALQRKKDAIRAGHGHLAPQMALIDEANTEDEASAVPDHEPAPQQFQAPGHPEDLLASASRELQRMLKIPPAASAQPTQAPAPPPGPAPAGFADPHQNKANALLAILQQGGTAAASAGNASATSSFTPPDFYRQLPPHPNAPQHPLYPPSSQGPPAPPPFHQQMPVHAAGAQPGQPDSAYNNQQYGAPRADGPQYGQAPYQQQQHQQAQQYHEQQQRLRLQPGQQPPHNYPYHHGQNAHPFAPMPQNLPPPPYTLQASANSQAQSAAAAFHARQQQQQQPRPQPQSQKPQPPPAPVPLLHPQPLPPTVQKALFTRESLASPDVSLAAPYAAGQQGKNIMAAPPPPPPLPPHQRGQQPPLSNHALALLSAFKKTDSSSRAEGSGSPSWPQQQQQQQQPQQHQQPSHQPPQQPPQPQLPPSLRAFSEGYQQQHGRHPQPNGPRQQYGAGVDAQHAEAGTQPPQPPQPQPPYAGAGVPNAIDAFLSSSSAKNNINGGSSSNSSNPFLPASGPSATNGGGGGGGPPFLTAPRPAHSEQHRNTLLGMFKQPAASSQVSASASAPAPPPHASASAVYNPAAASPSGQGLDSMAAAPHGAVNGGPVSGPGAVPAPTELNAELNLPFGALSLLTRPKGASNQSPQQAQHPSTYATPIAELPAGPTLLRRQPSIPQPASSNSPGGSSDRQLSAHPHPRPHQPATSTAAAAAAPAAGMRRPEPNPEHKQKLLALFSKQPQGSPLAAGGAGGGPHAPPGGFPSLPGSGSSSVDPAAKGRAGDAAGTGGAAARRGSQTPISPADRSFLLGYLASMSGAQ